MNRRQNWLAEEKKHQNPIIPPPPAKELAYTERLTEPPVQHVPLMEKRHTPALFLPHYGDLYDSLRTQNAWRYCADAFANGTILTVGGSQVSSAVKLSQNSFSRLSQWPGGIQLYLVIHQFGIAPQTATATTGSIECIYQDIVGGVQVPLGDFVSGTGGNVGMDLLIPTPVTDPGNLNVGNLLVALAPGGATVATYNWSIGFSFAYLFPSTQPEWKEEIGEK